MRSDVDLSYNRRNLHASCPSSYPKKKSKRRKGNPRPLSLGKREPACCPSCSILRSFCMGETRKAVCIISTNLEIMKTHPGNGGGDLDTIVLLGRLQARGEGLHIPSRISGGIGSPVHEPRRGPISKPRVYRSRGYGDSGRTPRGVRPSAVREDPDVAFTYPHAILAYIEIVRTRCDHWRHIADHPAA